MLDLGPPSPSPMGIGMRSFVLYHFYALFSTHWRKKNDIRSQFFEI
jgi:hypothetical protein